jgi:Bacteriophage tail sheath protein
MAVFNAFEKTPGVYIEEVLVPGPIPGVGTSTPVFIGPAKRGPIGVAVPIVNWTDFVTQFGVKDNRGRFDPYIPQPRVFAPHAVRGFFDNRGTKAYFLRVSTAVRASRTLMDRSAGGGKPALVVKAVDEGTAGNAITVEVADASLAAAVAQRATANLASASGKQAVLQNAADSANFKPGDTVLLNEAAKNDRAVIAGIAGANLTLDASLANTYTSAGTMRIADLEPNQTRIRLDTVNKIEPGTYVKITQGGTTENAVVQAVEGVNGFITLTSPLTQTFTMAAANPPVDVKTQEFRLIANANTTGSAPVAFDNLSMDPRHSRYVFSVVNGVKDPIVEVGPPDTPPVSVPPGNLPLVVAAIALQNGVPDDLSQITDQHYSDALDELEKTDDINMVCIPDRTDATVQGKAIGHCEKMQDRFAILDSPAGYTSVQIQAHRAQLSSDRGYAALYYPHLYVADPAGKGPLKIPPSGHVAGVYARTDNDKGVHKAPANEAVRGVLALERTLSDDDNGPLNEKSVNVIRFLPGRGFRIWGARTIAIETQWRYVNVRRLLLFLEESIQEGTQFAVFEPNNTALWQKVKRTVSEFLDRVWRTGALIGDKPEEAYRVRIDDELNPPSTIALGQLVIEVRVAPTTPAEFVVFQIIQDPGRKIVNE